MNTKSEKRPRIVVVDDEPDFLTIIESWLKPACEVAAFSRCDGLVEKVRVLAPDLVLLDVHMPQKSGFELCRELRSSPGLADLPVVFLTGSRTDEDFLLHLESGGTRYLTKPLGRKALLEALSEQLEGRKVS